MFSDPDYGSRASSDPPTGHEVPDIVDEDVDVPDMTDVGTDIHYHVRDDRGCEILTVGALREMLDGLDDHVQVVMDAPMKFWYVNVRDVIVPAGDDPVFAAVTLMAGDEIDTRQF